MDISLSNIIWPKGRENLSSFLNSLEDNGVKKVELALSCFWREPIDVSLAQVNELLSELEKKCIKVVSLHSLTYTRPDLEVFNSSHSRKKLINYIKRYFLIARKLKCKNLVFGSPGSRKCYNKSKQELDKIFFDFLVELNEHASGLAFNIEPLAKESCEYLNSFMEAVEIIDGKNLKNIFIQLDIRSIIESNEDIYEILDYSQFINHVHTGNPGLDVPGKEWLDRHQKIAMAMKARGYKGSVTAEVLNLRNEEPGRFMSKVVDVMRCLYE